MQPLVRRALCVLAFAATAAPAAGLRAQTYRVPEEPYPQAAYPLPAYQQPAPAYPPPPAAAPQPAALDEVVLTTGTVFTGTIVAQVPGSHVILQRPDGTQINLSWGQIAKINAAPRQAPPAPVYYPPPAPAPAPAPQYYSPPPQPQQPAGEPVVVTLVTGTVISGRLVGQVPGQSIVVERADGVRVNLPLEQVQSVNGAPPGAPQGATQWGLSGGGAALGYRTTLDDAEAKRQAWLRRGGAIMSYDVRAVGTVVVLPTMHLDPGGACGLDPAAVQQYAAQYAPKGLSAKDIRPVGGGGGAGIRAGLVYFSPPEPGHGGSWVGLHMKPGLDFSALAMVTPELKISYAGGKCSGGDVTYRTDTSMAITIPADLGIDFGLGGFNDQGRWRGVVLGLSYVPSYNYFKSGGGDWAGSLNYVGFGLNLDFTSLEAALERQASEAHFRIVLFLLPAIQDGWPWIFTLSLGAVWY